MLKVVCSHDKDWNYNQTTFDQDKTTLKLNPYTMTIIAILFPNIENIRLKLKPKSDLSDYLSQDLSPFNKLKKMSLTITDGASYNPHSPISIETLKIYYETICANDHYLKYILRKVTNLKNLTICETYIPVATMKFLIDQPIEKLSIKNPYIDKSETENFINILQHLKPKKLKLIHTQINDLDAEQIMFYVILNYLEVLPHKDLEELTISLPSCYENVTYSKIVSELTKLTKLNIFMSTNNNFNNLNQIIQLLNIIPYYLKTTITYYRTERSHRTHLTDIETLKANFPQIKIIEKINPYIAYPDFTKISQDRGKIKTYKKITSDFKEPKPYKVEKDLIIHNFPLIPIYNPDLEHEDVNLSEYLTSDESSDIEIENIDLESIEFIKKELMKATEQIDTEEVTK